MASFVYVLGCADARGKITRTYVGWTNDIDRRVTQHNSGTGAKSTRGRVWALLYVEKYDTPREAMQREWRLKREKAFRAQLRAL
ncbi:MAG: GIY-YIG nuclease family protein [Pseudomonadota bacterium]